MLQAGIEIQLTLRQPDNIPYSYQKTQRKQGNLTYIY